MKFHRQFSFREGFALLFFSALSVAGLLEGGVYAPIFTAVALIVVSAFAISAFVGSERLRAYSIGFLVPVLVYSTTLFSAGSSELTNELDPYSTLPSTKIIVTLFEFLLEEQYVHSKTGAVIENYDPAIGLGGFGGGGLGGSVVLTPTLDRPTFVAVAHPTLAMICGWIGARFALWIYVRNLDDRQHAG